ncbi:MAG: ABC transporter ATP-binding protein [Lachnospiraceae bacterium]|nr:ABC transporter ATP-binding protein [Lachnospiraceae bacterium]
MEKIISVKGLHKKYKNKVAVESVSFDVRAGEIMGLLGPNGAGKTTTLRMITNLAPCDKGEVIIKGKSIKKYPREAILHVGATLEIPSFFNELSGKDNLNYSAQMYNNIPSGRIEKLFELVGLKGKEKQLVKHYSTGMRQRLGLARTLIAEPELIILDEPANGLDPQGMIELYDLIKHLAVKKKIAFIVSSHLLDMEELCTDVLILNEGKSIVQGKTKELLRGKKDTICITSSNIEKLKDIFSAMDGLEVLRVSGLTYEIQLINITINNLLEKLIKNNIEILDFHVKQIQLEDLFLKMVGYKRK